jgi:uncharacterized membrane protein
VAELDLNRMVAYSLRIGVLLGALLSLGGLGLWAVRGFNVADANPSEDVLGMVGLAFSGSVTGVVYIGVLLLIATPIFRVALSAVYFSVGKDKGYVGITLLVLAMLIFALFSRAVV